MQTVFLVHKSSQMDSLYSGNLSTAGDASPSMTSEDKWKNIYREFLFSPHDSCLRARMKDPFNQGCKTKGDGRRAAVAHLVTEGRCRGAASWFTPDVLSFNLRNGKSLEPLVGCSLSRLLTQPWLLCTTWVSSWRLKKSVSRAAGNTRPCSFAWQAVFEWNDTLLVKSGWRGALVFHC